MQKHSILYRDIIVEGELMECVYFSNGDCTAQPVEMKMIHRMPFYKPTDEEKKSLCQTKDSFLNCGRFKGYQQHLQAAGLKK